jgi:hypothetical protein
VAELIAIVLGLRGVVLVVVVVIVIVVKLGRWGYCGWWLL